MLHGFSNTHCLCPSLAGLETPQHQWVMEGGNKTTAQLVLKRFNIAEGTDPHSTQINEVSYQYLSTGKRAFLRVPLKHEFIHEIRHLVTSMKIYLPNNYAHHAICRILVESMSSCSHNYVCMVSQ